MVFRDSSAGEANHFGYSKSLENCTPHTNTPLTEESSWITAEFLVVFLQLSFFVSTLLLSCGANYGFYLPFGSFMENEELERGQLRSCSPKKKTPPPNMQGEKQCCAWASLAEIFHAGKARRLRGLSTPAFPTGCPCFCHVFYPDNVVCLQGAAPCHPELLPHTLQLNHNQNLSRHPASVGHPVSSNSPRLLSE